MTLSLRGKLLAASLGVVLLMAALLGIVAFHTLKSRTLDAIQSEAVNYGHAHSVAIGNWLEDRKHAVDAPATPITRPWWLTGSARVTTICCMVTLT